VSMENIEQITDLRTAEPKASLHYGNVPLLTYADGPISIDGYSRAAVQTIWHVPECKLLFDVGANSWDLAHVPNLALSHAHPDHLAGFFSYLATRQMQKLPLANVFGPPELEEGLRKLCDGWKTLTGDEYPFTFIPLRAGECADLSERLVIKAIAMSHTLRGNGYIVYEKRKKLAAAHAQKSGSEIAELKKQGVNISEETLIPLVGFCGDSTAAILDQYPDLYQTRCLILECTYVSPSVDRAKSAEFGHVHVEDLIERADRFQNEMVVLGHFSTRWRRDQIIAELDSRLPQSLKKRAVLWI
jgi:ribonuclease Z